MPNNNSVTFAFEGKNGKKSPFYPFYLVTTKWLQKWVLEVSEVVHELQTRRFQVQELRFGSYEPVSMSTQRNGQKLTWQTTLHWKSGAMSLLVITRVVCAHLETDFTDVTSRQMWILNSDCCVVGVSSVKWFRLWRSLYASEPGSSVNQASLTYEILCASYAANDGMWNLYSCLFIVKNYSV